MGQTVGGATPITVAGGLVPMGAWSAIVTYAIGDSVSYTNGNSYISRTNANLNNLPTDTTNWQFLAGTGATGAAADTTDGTTTVTAPTALEFDGTKFDVIDNAGAAAITLAAASIVNADISVSAGIAFTKLAALADGKILVGNGSNQATAVTPSGDFTMTNAGVSTIADDAVTTAKILDANVTAGKLASDAVTTAKVLDGNITLAKMADLATNRLIGRVSSGTGVPEAVVLDTDGTLAANSDDIVATQKAVKTYCDNLTTNGAPVWSSGTAHSFEKDNGNAAATKTIDWTTGNNQKVTLIALAAPCVFTFTDPGSAAHLTLRVIQGGAGSYTVTWPNTCFWAGGTEPTLTTSVGACDVIVLYFDGTNYHCALAIADSKL